MFLTPWTTLPDLRLVADAIRRLNLSPHVGGALGSRLSLTAKSPLLAEARREGLLIEAERGPDEPVAWRFADDVVAAAVLAFTDAGRDDQGTLEALEEVLDAIAGVARGKQRRRLALVPSPAAAEKDGKRVDGIQRVELFGDVVRIDRRLAAVAIAAARRAATAGARGIVMAGWSRSAPGFWMTSWRCAAIWAYRACQSRPTRRASTTTARGRSRRRGSRAQSSRGEAAWRRASPASGARG